MSATPSGPAPPPALFSIHDVTPDGLGRVESLVELVRGAGHGPPLLLVVAGEDWQRGEARPLERLRTLVDTGCRLAGHGWSHRAPPPSGLGHRIHAAVLSRDQAEHLSRSREEVRTIVRRCFAWFGENGFEAPSVYTPPAWALGRLEREDLRDLPFRFYETLAGFVDSEAEPRGRITPLPLVGFEADTSIRRWSLKVSNGINVVLGRGFGWPVRIGLHPTDLELLMEDDVRALVGRAWTSLTVEQALGA